MTPQTHYLDLTSCNEKGKWDKWGKCLNYQLPKRVINQMQ